MADAGRIPTGGLHKTGARATHKPKRKPDSDAKQPAALPAREVDQPTSYSLASQQHRLVNNWTMDPRKRARHNPKEGGASAAQKPSWKERTDSFYEEDNKKVFGGYEQMAKVEETVSLKVGEKAIPDATVESIFLKRIDWNSGRTTGVDVKGPSHPGLGHIHQSMASWAMLGDDNVKSIGAGNMMKVVKGSEKPLIMTTEERVLDVAQPPEKGAMAKATDRGMIGPREIASEVTMAHEIIYAEGNYGGADAVLNAMVNLYIIKHDEMVDPPMGWGEKKQPHVWASNYYGAGKGAATELEKLSDPVEGGKARERAYKHLTPKLQSIHKHMVAEKGMKEGKEWLAKNENFDNWLDRKVEKWIAGYDPSWDRGPTVQSMLKLKTVELGPRRHK